MRHLAPVLLIFIALYAYGEVRMLGNVEDGKVLIYPIDPNICEAKNTIQFTMPEAGKGLLVVETIQCGDTIFSDGFDPN